VDQRQQARELLVSRRAKLTPAQANLPAEPGLTLTIYTAEPGSPSQQAPRLLDSWASTPDQARAVSSDSDT